MKTYLLIVSFLSVTYCDWTQNLKSRVCGGEWTEYHRFTSLVTLLKDHTSKNKSEALTYRRDKCDKSFPYQENNFPEELTAYLSDENKFLYLYVNIKSTQLQSSNTDLSIDYSMRASEKGKFSLVLWIRKKDQYEDINEISISYTSHGIKASVNNIRIKQNNSEQIWLKHSFDENNKKINLEIKKTNNDGINSAFDLNGSYIIFCAKLKSESKNEYSTKECYPTVTDDNQVICFCERNPINFYPMIIIGLFWLILSVLTIGLITVNVIKQSKNSVGLFEFVTCNKRNFKYHYVIVLKLGKASQTFDMQNTNIDIQFFDEINSSIGASIRFSSSLLSNKAMSDIGIHFFMINEMPTIKKIQCNHSCLGSDLGDARIYLFSITVLYLKNNQKVSQQKPMNQEPQHYKVNYYIVHDVRRLNVNLTDEDEDSDTDELSDYNIENKFSPLDLIWILFNIFTFIGLMCFLLPKPVFRNGLADTSLSVLYSTICGTIYGTILILLYKFIKKEEFTEKISNDNETGKWVYIKIGFCVLIGGISVVFGVLVLWFGQYMIAIETFYWLSATICSCAIFASIWLIISHCECAKNKISVSNDDTYSDSKSFSSTVSDDSTNTE